MRSRPRQLRSAPPRRRGWKHKRRLINQAAMNSSRTSTMLLKYSCIAVDELQKPDICEALASRRTCSPSAKNGRPPPYDHSFENFLRLHLQVLLNALLAARVHPAKQSLTQSTTESWISQLPVMPLQWHVPFLPHEVEVSCFWRCSHMRIAASSA